MAQKAKIRIDLGEWFKSLTSTPAPPRLTNRQRRELRRHQAEERHRKGFLDYVVWLLRQPAKRSKY